MTIEEKKTVETLEERIEFSKNINLQACNRMNWHPKEEKSLDVKLLELINKQEKIIQEMAIEINAGVLNKEDWCPMINKTGICDDDKHETCIRCLMEYFSKKVGE